MVEYILFFILGLFTGALSGLIPGLHPNLISAIAVLQNIEYENKAVFIVSMYSGHIIFSAIPSIFFGIPDEITAVSVLPGQRMVKDGRGIVALNIMVVSALLAAFGALLVTPAAMQFYPIAYSLVKPYILHVLVIASAVLVMRTKNPAYSIIIFLTAGFFGAYALKLQMEDAFLPLFSGFFAMGTILNYKKKEIKKQKEEALDFGILKYSLLGMVLGGLANLIPAISSPAQIAALASLFIAFETENYLATVAAINVGQFVFALASSASIEKARHGVIINLGQIVEIGNNMQMLLLYFLLGIAISGTALYILRKRISLLTNLDFTAFNKLLALYLVAVVFVLNALPGVLVFAVSSLIGYITLKLGVERTVMMGAIIVPTILLLIY